MTSEAERPATYRQVFAVGEFQALFAAQLLSAIGDQFARVALAVLVFNRTGSAALTTLTYALTLLPDLVSGPLLAGLADRYPRRTVMVITDVARACLVALMAVPGVPFAGLCALLLVVQLLNAPFNAARAATLAVAMDGDRYVVASGANNIMIQLAQVVGYAAGGTLVAGIGSSQALLVDAVTFVASALLVRYGSQHRPAPVRQDKEPTSLPWLASMSFGTRLVWTNRKLRSLVMLACVAGFYVIVEGLAVPYAREIGGGAVTAGFLFAASPAGAVLGMWTLSRWVRPTNRLRLVGLLAVSSCAPLLLCAWHPGLAVTTVLWMVSGASSSYHMVVSAEFIRAVPDTARGQAYGLAVTALKVSQGLGILLAGLGAEHLGAAATVAGFGALGVVAAVTAALAWRRANAETVLDDESAPRPVLGTADK